MSFHVTPASVLRQRPVTSAYIVFGTSGSRILFPGFLRAYVEGSVLMDGVQIGRGAVVRRAILDKDVVVPEGAHIGVEPDLDRERYHVTESGIVVLGKSQLALP